VTDASTRILFRGERFRLGKFVCGPESPRWREVNEIPSVPHIAFGGTNVVIHHLGGEPVLANRNHAVFYGGGQRYLRRLADPVGDHCLFVELDPDLVAELVGEDGFRFTHGPLPARHRLLLELIARHSPSGSNDVATEAVVLEVVAAAAEAAGQLMCRRPARNATDAAHAGLVESAKEILASDPAAPVSLGALAGRCHVSTFHLARVFRARTGFTLRGYRNHLRLRLALERLADPDVDLARLGLDLGFASHSHFSDSFRAAFGVPPSMVRDDGGRILRRFRGRTARAFKRRRPGESRLPPSPLSQSPSDDVDRLARRRRREEVRTEVVVHVADPDRVEAEVLAGRRARDRPQDRSVET
jgi:AraC-like DNA-binding protein